MAEPAPGLRDAIALSDLMLEMRTQRIRNQHPELSERDIIRLLNAELADRPMDGPGHPVPWPRPDR